MSQIGHMVYGNYQFGGYDHSDFGRANNSVFMEELHEALSHLQPHEDVDQFEEDLAKALDFEIHEAEYEDYEYE